MSNRTEGQALSSGPKGMRDLLAEETARFQHIESVAREVFRRYGFEEVRTPMVEHTEVFARSVGEATDIVQKEMYTFPDKAERSLTLRPEGTAGVVRAFVEHNVQSTDPLTRWYYIGPMFRHENVQKGRFRQFHQIGAEAYGAPSPVMDSELIDLARAFFLELGLTNLKFKLNSLGDAACRPKYLEALVAHLKSHAGELCQDCQSRLERNPLRVLDCKEDAGKPVLTTAPTMLDFLCDPCATHFAELKVLLGALGLAYSVDPRMVRGLDYYTRTVFEVTAESGDGLGSQDAVCGGGRYDDLVGRFGGPETPAIGFAIGMDRLAMLLADKAPASRAPDLFMAVAGEDARKDALRIAQGLRAGGLAVEIDERGGSVKAQMRRADKRKARYVVVLGGNEVASGRVKLKRMEDGSERDVALGELRSAAQSP